MPEESRNSYDFPRIPHNKPASHESDVISSLIYYLTLLYVLGGGVKGHLRRLNLYPNHRLNVFWEAAERVYSGRCVDDEKIWPCAYGSSLRYQM